MIFQILESFMNYEVWWIESTIEGQKEDYDPITTIF